MTKPRKSNRPKQAGTRAESAFVRYLRTHGWPDADRSPLRGSRDQGDTTGHPGFVCEVKWQSKGTPGYSRWIFEAEAEAANAGAQFGHVVYSPPGIGEQNIDHWVSIMSAGAARALRAKAGSPDTLSVERSGHRMDTMSWLRLTEEERIAVGHPFMEVNVRPLGVSDPDRYYNLMWLPQRLELFRLAGF